MPLHADAHVQWDGPWGPAKGSRSSKSNYVHLVRSSVLCDAGRAECMPW